MNTHEHLTIDEASSAFRIGRTKLYQLISSGDITAVKLGRRTLITADSARKFMDGLPIISAKIR